MGGPSGRYCSLALALAAAALVVPAGCASLPQPADEQQSLLVFYWETDQDIPAADLPTSDTLFIAGPVAEQIELQAEPWGYSAVALAPGSYRIERRVTRWGNGRLLEGPPPGAAEIALGVSEVQLVPLAFYRTSEEQARAGANATVIEPQQKRRVSRTLRDRVSLSRWAGRTARGFEPFSPFEEYTQSRYRVEIVSEPPDARVLIDDQEWGNTPLTVTLPAGKHFIILQREGYLSEHGFLSVAGDGTSTYQLSPTQDLAQREDTALRAVLMPFDNIGRSEDEYLASVFFDSLQVALEREGLEVIPYDRNAQDSGASRGPGGLDFAFAESTGARLIVSGDYLGSGEEVLVHAALHDVQSELVKAGLLFNRPGGFEIFDSVDSITQEFGLAVSRVLPEIGQPVVEDRRLTGEGRAFSERLAERGVVQRRMEYPRALDAGLIYGTLQDELQLEGAEIRRLDGAGASFGANVSFDYRLSEALSGVVQLGVFYTGPDGEGNGDNSGSLHIPLYVGPRVTFRGYKNDIYLGVLGAWHFATARTVSARAEGTDDLVSAEVGPYWFSTLNLDTGLRVYLGDDLSRRPTFLTFGLLLGIGGYRFEIDFSDADPADFEVWLRGGMGVRL